MILSFTLVGDLAAQIPSRAEKYFNQAMEWHRKSEPEKAIASMRQAIRIDPRYQNAYGALGAWLFHARDYEEASQVFKKAIAALPQQRRAFALPLARCLIHQGRAEEALRLLAAEPMDGSPEWEKVHKQARFLSSQPPKDTTYQLRRLDARVNSPLPELSPSLATDTQTLYFSRPSPRGDLDLYYAHRDSCGGWFTAKPFGSPPNTRNHELAQMISADGHYIFFTRSDARSESGWGRGGFDLYMAYTGDSVWSIPQSFGATINTSAYEGMPCLSADNRELYFSSNRPGGYGGMDIWVSRFEGGLWQAPRNLGPTINTEGDETMPFLHLDNESLYFSSDGHPGYGGQDLFLSRRIQDTVWSPPTNLGHPFNSSANESALTMDIWGHRAWISSDRGGSQGQFDLFYGLVPPSLKPNPVVIIKGVTKDSLEGHRLPNSRILVFRHPEPRPIYQFVSNRGDGSFMMTLPQGEQYHLETATVHYQPRMDSLDLRDSDSTFMMTWDIGLLPRGYQPPTEDSLLLVLHFQKNQIQLSDSLQDLVRASVDFWLDKKDVRFQVDAYTDNSGTPLINESYSQQRAAHVQALLWSQGLGTDAVYASGWGEENPVASNETEEGRDANRRVEIRVHFPHYLK